MQELAVVAPAFAEMANGAKRYDTCVAECRAELLVDEESKVEGWERFKAVPPPLGYDPGIIPQRRALRRSSGRGSIVARCSRSRPSLARRSGRGGHRAPARDLGPGDGDRVDLAHTARVTRRGRHCAGIGNPRPPGGPRVTLR